MEWVETTAKTVDEAKDQALDQLGVAADEAEFDVLDEPKSGLFGRTRGEARVRARVKPAAVRPKQERRQRGRNQKRDNKKSGSSNGASSTDPAPAAKQATADKPAAKSSNGAAKQRSGGTSQKPRQNKENRDMDQESSAPTVSPQEVGDAAVAFMSGLTSAFGVEDASTELTVDGTDLDVRVTGGEVGLMVGPGGRTLTAIQDLARVASQRRLGDHDTRLRIDVGGYREKRRGALEKFAATVAAQVIETGEPKALEPMASADRKAVHDAVIEIDGVTSHSEGDDPSRRVVITPG